MDDELWSQWLMYSTPPQPSHLSFTRDEHTYAQTKQSNSSSFGQHQYVPATAGGAIGSSSLGPHLTRTRVKVVRLEKEVADYHLRQAAQRGQGPETVKVRWSVVIRGF